MSSFFKSLKRDLPVKGRTYHMINLEAAVCDVARLPCSLKVLLENSIRCTAKKSATTPFLQWIQTVEQRSAPKNTSPVSFMPTRVLMQDFTGVPAVVDLAAMRNALQERQVSAHRVNPVLPVDLVIDHSVMVNYAGSPEALKQNTQKEFDQNKERYQLLRWAQQSFKNFRVIPPGSGICHQVNLECLSRCIAVSEKKDNGTPWAYPELLIGTDSHTTMINALGVLGWGVGGIEAEAAMLGQSLSMTVPDVVGIHLTGKVNSGITATDLVLTITHLLRQHGVVGKFVEFFGDGLGQLSLADRATLSNMSPEFGSTCAYFPVDRETLRYLHLTGRPQEHIDLVETYAQAQGLWREDGMTAPLFTQTLQVDLGALQPVLAGPKRPQDKLTLGHVSSSAKKEIVDGDATRKSSLVKSGDVVIAAITSCTNTSNPSLMIAAGLLAENAQKRGLRPPPWVKTSFAPGSKVVTAYMVKAGLMKSLEVLGFHVVGYGCTTCIGNSGPLDPDIDAAIATYDLCVGAVLSGNRNFEGRIHPQVKLNYLASPALVVAYALAGSFLIDLTRQPLGYDHNKNPVFLNDIWPKTQEIQDFVEKHVHSHMFHKEYAKIFDGDTAWKSLPVKESVTYAWDKKSTYVKEPPYFSEKHHAFQEISEARILALLGHSVTTDHISPAGVIPQDSPAGLYLRKRGVSPQNFNAYGARRGNHEVMMRGTFANVRLQNHMTPHRQGGYTLLHPQGEEVAIFDAAMAYAAQKTPLVVFAGKDYGVGSSRDWAAKGTHMLGVAAVIAESFERIHRSNLIGMGVLPLQFPKNVTWEKLGLDGSETVIVSSIPHKPQQKATVEIIKASGQRSRLRVLCCLATEDEVRYYHGGGIFPVVLKELINQEK